MGMILLLRTCSHKNPPEILEAFVPGLIPTFWKVFNSNNDPLLRKFFLEPMIKELWLDFSRSCLVKILNKLDERERKLMRKDFEKY